MWLPEFAPRVEGPVSFGASATQLSRPSPINDWANRAVRLGVGPLYDVRTKEGVPKRGKVMGMPGGRGHDSEMGR